MLSFRSIVCFLIVTSPKNLLGFFIDEEDNESIKEWWGVSCCPFAKSDNCKQVCGQAQTRSELISFCGPSDGLVYKCLQEEEAIQKCCKEAESLDCFEACSRTSSGNSPTLPCSSSPRVMDCFHSTLDPGHQSNAKSSECCDQSPWSSCRTACKQILSLYYPPEVDVIGELINSGCGHPLPHDKLWNCFLTINEQKKPPTDLIKLQCCFRATSDICRNLCLKTFGGSWSSTWNALEESCQFHSAEEELRQCLSEVDDKCDFGCRELSFCEMFNERSTDLYRRCDTPADDAAHRDMILWKQGAVRMPVLGTPLFNLSGCPPETRKLIACVLQVQPCNADSHTNRICKSDCVSILSTCTDNLPQGQTVDAMCDIFSTAADQQNCVSLKAYTNSNTNKEHVPTSNLIQPCRKNPCQKNELCVVNNDCQPDIDQQCPSYKCIAGCRLGDLSTVIMPGSSYLLIEKENEKCSSVFHCSQRGNFLEIGSLPCVGASRCWLSGRKPIEHGHRFKLNCNDCLCYAGEIKCSDRRCSKTSVLPSVSEKNETGCVGIQCPKLSKECVILFPPQVCCAVCGGGIFRLTYSSKMLGDLVRVTKDEQLSSVDSFIQRLRQHSRLLQCQMSGFSDSEDRVIVMVLPNAAKFARACAAEAQRLRVQVQNRIPTLMMVLPLPCVAGVDSVDFMPSNAAELLTLTHTLLFLVLCNTFYYARLNFMH